MKKAKYNIKQLTQAKTKRCTMKPSEFIKAIAEDAQKNVKQIGVDIGRGEGSSFSRTVNTEMLRVEDLRKCIECTGQDFVILFKGLRVHIE